MAFVPIGTADAREKRPNTTMEWCPVWAMMTRSYLATLAAAVARPDAH